MDALYAAVFIVIVDKEWSPRTQSNGKKITIYCTNCKYCGGKLPTSIVLFDSKRDDLKSKLRQAQISGFNNWNGMMWRLKGIYNMHTEPLNEAVDYFISILEQGEFIHPFLEGHGFPKLFSSVMHVLLLNFTKHGIQNMGTSL